ncbi:preprotein translocase subunit SecD [Actinomyces bovis]|uniref:Protein translocase subunit SecD n=1 Tax=Actinomyces bovis TaxID=1658 RepID=A0ABY1VPN2_9ACTO|nr:protein translocase subunit SecD [Actinomyces bovis]SPT54086.1 preprotein translocase subunit SecD [Actinomyces bovis]VEG53704.1 preprotein translocase subunit SecD [Actinomyces israelii]
MSTKQLKRPGRVITALLLIIALAYGLLVYGAATKRTSMTPGLALDLEGGTQLILTPTTTDGSEITDKNVDEAINIIRQRVDASGVAEAQISRQGGQNIVVSLPGSPSAETLELVRTSAVLYFRPVLRILRGSATRIAEAQNRIAAQAASAAASASASAAPTDGATAPSTDSETASPTPEPTPTETAEAAADQPSTAAPEASATPTAVPTVTAEQVATRYADANGDGQVTDTPLNATSQDSSSDASLTEKMLYDAYMTDCTAEQNLKGGPQDPTKAVISCAKDGSGTTYLLGPADIAGTEIKNAQSGLETTSQGKTTNKWVVNLEFDDKGTQTFAEVSKRLIAFRDAAKAEAAAAKGKPQSTPTTHNSEKAQFAIVLDGLTIMASGFAEGVTNGITDGRVQISGGFKQAGANTLANQLSFGSLPLTFTVQSEQQISATLGTEQLRNGLIAGVIGFLLIIVYLAWQYRGLSIVAVASLLMAAVITYVVIALLSWSMGYRLSLAGVAGLIVSIGITMDSFIIYFERIRDEVRLGRTLRAAVDEGWKHARQTIVVSDSVNLVAAVVLYFLAVGGVQGFAFTLGVTTVVDLLVIFLFTHPMMAFILRFPFFGQGHRLSGLDPEHLGARSLEAYGKGREAIAGAVAGSLARRKAEQRQAAQEGGLAVEAEATSGKDGDQE